MPLVQVWGDGSTTGLFNSSATPKTFNTGVNFAGSNGVIILTEWFAGTTTEELTGVTVAGTSCTKLAEANVGGAAKSALWWCATNAGGSDAVVLTYGGGAGSKAGFVSVLEWSGITGLDTGCENSNDQTSPTHTAPTVSTAISTTTNNTLLAAVSGNNASGACTYTTPTGWTQIGEIEDGTTYDAGHTCYKVDTSAAVETATWTTSATVSSYNCIAAFKLSAESTPLMGQASL